MIENCENISSFSSSNADKDRVESDDRTYTMGSSIYWLFMFTSGLLAALMLACFTSFSDHVFKSKLINTRTFLPTAYYPSSSSVWEETQTRISSKAAATKIDLHNEAVSAMHLALEMQEKGKIEKAVKLFQHAYNLNPTHADVAFHYGQHLENHQDDIIFAEHLYTKALVLNPDHKRAMIRQQRISPLVRELDELTLSRIDHKRAELYKVPDHHPGLRRIKHESYINHIYHTIAIEGNSMSYSEVRHVLETKLAIEGKSVHEHAEIVGVDQALRYINSSLLTRWGQIDLDDILEIHKRVLGPVDPGEAGRLRRNQVFIAEHRPPPADELLAIMNEFIDWMNAPSTLRLHPIEFAALAHYKFVYIHPFIDGNGRTARLLMNVILMQSGYPPVTIKVSQKHRYYSKIVTANEGDVRPFIRFIAQCTEETLDDFLMCASSETHDLVVSDHFKASLDEEKKSTEFIIKDRT